MSDVTSVSSHQYTAEVGTELVAHFRGPDRSVPWVDGSDHPDRVLEVLIARALEEPDIIAGLNSADEFGDDDTRAAKVLAALDVSKNVIFASGSSEESIYQQLISQLESMRTTTGLKWWRLCLIVVAALTSLLLWLDLLGEALFQYIDGLVRPLGGPEQHIAMIVTEALILLSITLLLILIMRSRPALALFLAASVFLVLITVMFSVVSLPNWPAVPIVVTLFLSSLLYLAFERQETLRRRSRKSLAELPHDLQDQAWDAFSRWVSILYSRGVVPALSTLINDRMSEQFSTELRYRAEFLSQWSADGTLHQRTPIGFELAELFRVLKSGSFAVSGPRGAGKSDVMAAFCRGSYHSSPRHDVVVSVSAPVEYQPADFMLYLHAELCDAVIGYIKARDRTAVELVDQRRQVDRYPLGLRLSRPPALTGQADMLYQAYKRRDEIQYLLTVGGEASGRLGFRSSQVATKKSVSKAEQPRTYPQIVNRLRKDLEYVAERLATLSSTEGAPCPRLVVSIDELDRIQSADRAIQFVNEIKAIFRVPNCYFLVSVSEDALQEFELAAMGVRTAVDSAFDEVLWVDYLDFALSKKLLNNYVVGFSEQFLAFAYVRSGGLARQLVRTARELINWATQRPGAPMSSVVSALAESDLRRVCEAVKGSLIKISSRSAVAALVRALDDYPSGELSEQVLVDYTIQLVTCQVGSDPQARDLRDTMAARTLFLATLVGVFSSELDEGRMKTGADPARPGASFNALARVRRYLGANPQAALELLGDFRVHWCMTAVDLTPLNDSLPKA